MTDQDPVSADPDPLDALADRLLSDLEAEASAPPNPARGLDWIRNTLRRGGDHGDPLIGTLFQDKYRILRRIGKGGFGAVYEAVDERGAKNRVALKIQLPGFAPSRERRETFRNEAIRVTRLNHPNIVDWKSFDETPDGGSYFVMELLDGVELSDALRKEGALEPQRAERLLLQILGALRAAHFVARGQSILHLDLKPKNILLLPEQEGRPEKVKVIDFGIGQFLGGDVCSPSVPAESAAPAVPAVVPTARGSITAVAGGTSAAVAARASAYPFEISQAYTAEYASPEHCVHIEFSSGQDCEPRALDGRSDLYSFGVIAYELLTGRLPYKTPVHRPAWLRLHQEAPMEPWGEFEARIPGNLRRFVERCLEKNPDERFADTRVALEELERIVTPPIGKRLALAAVGLVLAGVVLSQWLSQPGGRLAVLENGVELETHHQGPGSVPWTLRLQRADGQRPIDGDTPLQLTSASGDGLASWSVQSTPITGLFVIAPPTGFATANEGRRAFPRARVESLDGAWRSDPFALVWLGAETSRSALTIGERTISANAEVLELDPQGLWLELRFPALTPADLAAEDWSLTAAGLPLDLQVSTHSGTGAVLRAALDDLPSGPVDLHLQGRDRADVLQAFQVPLLVNRVGLEVALQLHGPDDATPTPWAMDQRRSFFQGEALQLGLSINRLVDLNFAGQPLVAGGPDPLRIELANWLSEQRPDVNLQHDLELSDRVLHEPTLSGERHRLRIALPLRVLSTPQVSWFSTQPLTLDMFGTAPASRVLSNGRKPIQLRSSKPLARDRFAIDVAVDEGTLHTLPLTDQGMLELDSLLPRDGEELREGEYTVRIATHVLDARGQRLTLSALAVQEFQVAVDRSAPSIDAPDTPQAVVRGLTQEWQLEFAAPQDSGSPVALEWQVFAEQHTGPLQKGVTLPTTNADGQAVFVLAPLRKIEAARSLEDGRYAVQVTALDRAGNSAFVGQFGVQLARRAPQLTVLEPAQEVLTLIIPWRAPAGQLDPIVVEARDPNGVREMECSVYRQDRGPLAAGSRHFAADPVLIPSGETQATWSWTFDPPPSWSLATDVMILFKATDQHGQVQITPYGPLQLPRIRESYPEHLQGMWLVPGNPGAVYTFKGRPSVLEENHCFTEAGLTPIWVAPGREKPGEAESAWSLPLAAGALGPYYLAEREVSTAEVLLFLRDISGGYMNRSHWREGQVPRDARRRELLALYATRPAAQAASDIWHSEASAFAHFSGKRLPTLLELTFAIRGGASLYRAHSWDAGSGATPEPTSPWKRIRGLSSGAEWTASPVTLDRRGGLPVTPSDARHFLSGSPTPRRVEEPYWISGTPAGRLAIDESNLRSDFAAVDVGDPQHWSDTRVGFRLAWSADDALEQERGKARPLQRDNGDER